MIGRSRTRTLRKDRTGANPLLVGLLVAVVAVIGVYFGFTKANPFANPFEVKAVFESAVSIRKNSPVRVAGVNIGKVKRVERQDGTDAAVVHLEVQDKALPIHKDATLKIRPRIFLEGNFFVDLEPGTPGAPTIRSGDTIAMTQTATPVQLDQVLTALQSDTRESLKTLLRGYGEALTAEPTVTDDRNGDPLTQGETAAESLNDATRTGADALRGTSIVNDALQGEEQGDLGGLIKSLGQVTAALDTRKPQLQDLITNFNVTMGALASESTNLRASIRGLAPTLRTTSRTLGTLNAAFPSTRAFARELIPGVRETPATITAARPWIAQTRKLLGERELRGLVRELRPTTANLSRVVDTGVQLLPQIDDLSQCLSKVILPTGDIKIEDGNLTTNRENYKEFWYAMVGLAGESQNFDGNGPYVRFQTGGGDQSISTGTGGTLQEPIFANVSSPPIGTRPAYPQRRPPYRPEAPCKEQRIPDLNAAKNGRADAVGRAGVRIAPTPAEKAKVEAAKAEAATPGAAPKLEGTLTGDLVSRLNPFAGGAGR
jgi:phospholipid/cholesterol/gamma-HCH transport system substrate-binding protein